MAPDDLKQKVVRHVRSNTAPISRRVASLRWSLFGHVLWLDDEVLAKKAMALYCSQEKGKRGTQTEDDFASHVMGRSKESIRERTQLEGVQ